MSLLGRDILVLVTQIVPHSEWNKNKYLRVRPSHMISITILSTYLAICNLSQSEEEDSTCNFLLLRMRSFLATVSQDKRND